MSHLHLNPAGEWCSEASPTHVTREGDEVVGDASVVVLFDHETFLALLWMPREGPVREPESLRLLDRVDDSPTEDDDEQSESQQAQRGQAAFNGRRRWIHTKSGPAMRLPSSEAVSGSLKGVPTGANDSGVPVVAVAGR